MGETRRVFTKEFKQEIVKLITDQGKSIGELSKDINVCDSVIRRWVHQYKTEGIDAFPGKGKLLPADEEMRALKRRLADLEEENAILKKAVAIFTKPTK